jgi:aminoglycoside phosphotransferase (APT) family kinase protein
VSAWAVDPSRVAADPELRTIPPAIDPVAAQQQLARQLPRLAGEDGVVHVRAIRVTRHKPGRRCVIEYDVEVERPGDVPEALTLIGKIRRRRSGRSGYRLLSSLWDAGFAADAADGIVVPEPIGVVPELRMWLQRKVSGRVATELLPDAGGEALALRIAEAAHKLHRANVRTERERRHTMADELRILHECLPHVARGEPRWNGRIERLLNACDRLAAATPTSPPAWIHRDFYGDQVLVDGERLYLIDFDEYCEGDPALDVGNFLGAVTEHSLRTVGDPDALADVERALENRFLELSGRVRAATIRAYETLTLVRHVYVSTRFPDRRRHTGELLSLCEERLGIAGRVHARVSG